MMVTMTLTEFLLARIAEDEDVARAAGTSGDDLRWWVDGPAKVSGKWWIYSTGENFTHEHTARHIARHDPARVLAECEAKRAIVTEYAARDEDTDLMLGVTGDALRQRQWSGLRLAVHALASVYADHPDHPDNRKDES